MRRQLTTFAVLLAGTAALVGPARAEWAALQQLRQGIERCADGSAGPCGGLARADIDTEGLHLWHPWAERGGIHAEADEVSISIGLDGVTVDAQGMLLSRATPPAPTPSASASSVESASADRIESRAPARSPLVTHGIPVLVRVHGPATWRLAGVSLDLHEPELRLDGHGGAEARFGLDVEGNGIRVHGLDRWDAHAIDGDPRAWHATGPLSLADGPATLAALSISPDGVEASIHDGTGGVLALDAPLPAPGTRRPAWLSITAESFSLESLGTTGRRSLDAWGIDPEGASLDGTLTLSTDRSGHSVVVDWLELHDLVVDSPKLAREPVQLDDLRLHGEGHWGDGALDLRLWVAHRAAELGLEASLAPEALRLRAELAPLPCQALVDALPDAMTEMLSGTELRGEIEASADLFVDRSGLVDARALPHRATDAPPPGELSVWFPFLERCTVERDDPRLDLAALGGPYRHRFVDAEGNHHARLLARGAPGYVPLAEVPLIARAFVTLEDRRFWSHDGFDREQIVNAFWHNLVQGRVSRGASTISQQAARNLWLGVDRSWGRKLQEALLTARLEASTPKPRIMELYLNVIELGPGTHGVKDAAKLYFGKPASELSVLQSLHLAALAPAPNRYAASFEDGRVTPEWRQMLRRHARRMYRAGFISRAQMLRALRDDLGLLDRSAD